MGARIDLAESKLEGLYISNARNKLFIDHIFTFHKLFLKNTKKEFSIGLGCGLNNFNSDYTYTKINRDNIGQITSVSHGNSDYQFSSFNFGVEKKYKKLMYGIGMEYVFGHNFLEPSMFIMPNIIIKYKLNNLLKKQ